MHSAVREAWIRAKYVTLSFVKNIASARCAVDAVPESPLRSGRRWSVRRARRRSEHVHVSMLSVRAVARDAAANFLLLIANNPIRLGWTSGDILHSETQHILTDKLFAGFAHRPLCQRQSMTRKATSTATQVVINSIYFSCFPNAVIKKFFKGKSEKCIHNQVLFIIVDMRMLIMRWYLH